MNPWTYIEYHLLRNVIIDMIEYDLLRNIIIEMKISIDPVCISSLRRITTEMIDKEPVVDSRVS